MPELHYRWGEARSWLALTPVGRRLSELLMAAVLCLAVP